MSAIRSSVSVVLAIGLLAGSAVGAVAQEGAEGSSPAVATDVYYADDDVKQVMHVFGHESDGQARPAVVIIHGGAFVIGYPYFEEDLAHRYHDQGYVSILLGYRLMNEETFEDAWPAQIDDAQRAMRWIRANADEYGVDPDRVCALGFSAGGQLASLLGSSDSSTDAEPTLDGFSSRATCVVTLAGEGDLMQPQESYVEENFEALMGGTREEQREKWESASPALNVDEDTVPFLVIHGVDDTDVRVGSARSLVDALIASEVEVVYAELPDDHFGIRDDALTWDLVDAFLSKHLGPER